MGFRQDSRGGYVGGRSKRAGRQSRRPQGRLPQQDDHGRCDTARGGGRGVDPQGDRASACRCPVDLQSTGVTRGRNATLPRTHSAAMPRTYGEVRLAVDRERCRYRCCDEGGHLRTRRRPDHTGQGGEDRGGGRHLRPGDRDQRLRTTSAAGRDRPFQPAGRSRDMYGAGPNGSHYNP
jgi:hypothetical protein